MTSLLLAALYFWTDATTQTLGRQTNKQHREQRHVAEELSIWAAPPDSSPAKGIYNPRWAEGDLPQRDVEAAVVDMGEQWEETVVATTSDKGGRGGREGTAGVDEVPRAAQWCPLPCPRCLRCSDTVDVWMIAALVLPGILAVVQQEVVFAWITGAQQVLQQLKTK